MALTFAQAAEVGQVPMEPVFVTEVDLTYDNSYPAGGYDLAFATNMAGHSILGAVPMGFASDGRLAEFDKTAGKLKVMKINTTTGLAVEETAATDLTGVTQKILVISR